MRIFVTGAEGYLGSLLTPELLRRGYQVIGLDTGFYKERSLYDDGELIKRFTLVKDIRQIETEDLKGIDAIVHMAELSNDPAGALSPHITYEINHAGSVRLANLAKQAGVARFVYMSSCSVYGVAEGIIDESKRIDPQTAYAKCKCLVERDVSLLADEHFSPVFMRNATAYGASPRMRFDIVLNNLAGLAWTTREISMTSDGTPWRPLVHGLDIAAAIIAALEAPREAVHNEIFNVGDNAGNYRVREIAEIVAAAFPGCQVAFGSGADNRSYRVSFDKIRAHLPGFKCAWDAERGARQLYELFNRIRLTPEDFSYRSFTRLKQLEYLLKTKQIDDHFFWRI